MNYLMDSPKTRGLNATRSPIRPFRWESSEGSSVLTGIQQPQNLHLGGRVCWTGTRHSRSTQLGEMTREVVPRHQASVPLVPHANWKRKVHGREARTAGAHWFNTWNITSLQFMQQVVLALYQFKLYVCHCLDDSINANKAISVSRNTAWKRSH
jgi:hypothetical protein